MATLENIRKRGPLVAIIIGLALFAFILGDLFSNGGKLMSGSQFRLAEINGEEIDYREYDQKVKEETENFQRNRNVESVTEDQREWIRESVWENMVQKILLEGEYKAIGLDVSTDELFDLMQGKNVDPLVYQQQAFVNPETGMFDPARVAYFVKNRAQDESGETEKYLFNLENQVKENRKIRKYFTLVEKGLYFPKMLVESDFKSRNYLVDFDYVGKGYSEVSDSSITLNQNDLEKYYDEHKKEFDQEASRSISYVTFDIIPSKEDTLDSKKEIDKLAEEFKSTQDNKQFISFNSDVPFNPIHVKKGEIENAELDSFAFSVDTGKIFGPYFEDGSFKLSKLLKISNLPDTIEAKHILIAINGSTIPDITRAKLVADSLKKAIEGGSDFATVAKEFSADKATAEEGGNLGKFIEGQSVNEIPIKPFDELTDKKLNEINQIEKPYGIHLLVKTSSGPEVKKVQLGTIERKIVASTKTYQQIYAKAVKFAGENRKLKNFDESITKQGLIKKEAPGLTENGTFISGLENPRQLIRWAFEAKVGEVSEVKEIGKRYVVGALTQIREKGIAPIEQVMDQVKIGAMKDKKAELLIKQFNQLMPSDIAGLALKLKKEVKESRNVSFSTFQISGMGYEPAIIATAVTSPKGKISQPIKGENGVYVINVKIITPAMNTEKMDLSADKTKLTKDLVQRIYPNQNYGDPGQLLTALKESAEIEDSRAKFF